MVAQYETTVGEYIEYLTAQSPEERLLRVPPKTEVGLTQVSDTVWEYSFPQGEELRVARTGSALQLRGTDGPVLIDWTRLPISGLTWDDAAAYLSWLGDTGRVPGARLCSEYEWERASRGADDRKYPHGDTISNGEANFAKGHDIALMTLAPVGSFPLSVSPFGLQDTTGNVFEWVSSCYNGLKPESAGNFHHLMYLLPRNPYLTNDGNSRMFLIISFPSTASAMSLSSLSMEEVTPATFTVPSRVIMTGRLPGATVLESDSGKGMVI